VTVTSTVIARQGADRYAFYRGTRALGQAQQEAHRARVQQVLGEEFQQLDEQAYFKNELDFNRDNQGLRLENFQQEVDRSRKGFQVKQVR